MFGKRSFKGYRSHPIYLEKVNNYMLSVKAKSDPESVYAGYDEAEANSMQDNYRRQQDQYNNRYASSSTSLNSGLNHGGSRQTSRQQPMSKQTSRSNAFQPEQASREQGGGSKTYTRNGGGNNNGGGGSRTVSSSDLRNKQSAVSNNKYQGVSQSNYNNFKRQNNQPSSGSLMNGGRRNPSYRVNLSISTGSFQADQY